MDGFKKRLNQSIQFRLSFFLALAILLIAVAASVFSFFMALEDAHEQQDDTLYQLAALISQENLVSTFASTVIRLSDDDEDSHVIIQRIGQDIIPPSGSAADHHILLPSFLDEGLHTIKSGKDTFRVLIKSLPDGQRYAIAQDTSLRNRVSRDSALRTVIPFLLLIPTLLLVVATLVRRMFQPIIEIAGEIDARTEDDLHPIPYEHLPTEIRPFVRAINRLLDRVGQAISAQQRFVADAAHELRSPMTALQLQAQWLSETELSEVARERLDPLRQGIKRSRNLLDQLLSLARAQSSTRLQPSAVAIQTVFRQVLEDLVPLAQAKQIDLGVTDSQDTLVWASAPDLSTVIKNLIDNAIRYTPKGGRVDLSVERNGQYATLHVRDTGPGIPDDERVRVFDPFYRVLGSKQMGSGLGLSIVKTILDRMGTKLDLGYSDTTTQSGLDASVVLYRVDADRSFP